MCSHVRLRDCFPSPHVAEHGVQEPHIAHCQQGLMLQSPVPLSLPGQFASFDRGTNPSDLRRDGTILHSLFLFRIPSVPHISEQVVHVVHGVHSNTVGGQSSKLQNNTDIEGPGHGSSSVSTSSSRDFPYRLRLGTTHCRNRFVIPPPQVCVHLDHSDHSVHSAHFPFEHPSVTSDFPPPHGFSSAANIVLKQVQFSLYFTKVYIAI